MLQDQAFLARDVLYSQTTRGHNPFLLEVAFGQVSAHSDEKSNRCPTEHTTAGAWGQGSGHATGRLQTTPADKHKGARYQQVITYPRSEVSWPPAGLYKRQSDSHDYRSSRRGCKLEATVGVRNFTAL